MAPLGVGSPSVILVLISSNSFPFLALWGSRSLSEQQKHFIVLLLLGCLVLSLSEG